MSLMLPSRISVRILHTCAYQFYHDQTKIKFIVHFLMRSKTSKTKGILRLAYIFHHVGRITHPPIGDDDTKELTTTGLESSPYSLDLA